MPIVSYLSKPFYLLFAIFTKNDRNLSRLNTKNNRTKHKKLLSVV